MNRIQVYTFLAVGVTLTFEACVSSQPADTERESTYSENISHYRSSYADSLKDEIQMSLAVDSELGAVLTNVDNNYAINAPLNDLLDRVTIRNAEVNSYQGYTVQVYNGRSRKEGTQIKNKVYFLLPDSSPQLKWEAPAWKVKVGEFTSRLEAQQVYSTLKKIFPVTLIVPEQFPVVENN